MAANFWASSHCKVWLFSKETLDNNSHRRDKDELKFTEQEIKRIKVHLSIELQSLGKRLSLRQRVIASAIVYFRRFYARNNFLEFCPRLVAPSCLYIATKVEECSTQCPAYRIANEMKKQDPSWPYSNSHILECEFHVLETLGFYLVVYHPYRSLTDYLSDGNCQQCLESAWSIVNDAYCTDLPLLYPPYVISLACIQLAALVNNVDLRVWFCELVVDMKDIWMATSELLDFYEQWRKERSELTTVKQLFEKLPSFPKYTAAGSPSYSTPVHPSNTSSLFQNSLAKPTKAEYR